MNMKMNLPVTLGIIVGWFILAPVVDAISLLFFPIPLIDRTPLETIANSVWGLLFAIVVGLIVGIYDDIQEQYKKHSKMMIDYKKLKIEMEKQNDKRK